MFTMMMMDDTVIMHHPERLIKPRAVRGWSFHSSVPPSLAKRRVVRITRRSFASAFALCVTEMRSPFIDDDSEGSEMDIDASTRTLTRT